MNSGMIEYLRKSVIGHFQTATSSFTGGNGYTLTPNNYFSLLMALLTCTKIMGWTDAGNDILLVPDNDGDKLSILKSYGIPSLLNVTQAKEITLIGHTQNKHDSILLYHCLLNSLSDRAKKNSSAGQSGVHHVVQLGPQYPL